MIADLMTLSASDVVRKCRLAHSEVQEIINIAFDELRGPVLCSLGDVDMPRDDIFTTGDLLLDKVLGSGIRTRKIWEIVGERYARLCPPCRTVDRAGN